MLKLLPLMLLAACVSADRALVIKGEILAQEAVPNDCQLEVRSDRTGEVLAVETGLHGSSLDSNHQEEFVSSIWEELPASGYYYVVIKCKSYSHGYRSAKFDFEHDTFVDLGEVVVLR